MRWVVPILALGGCHWVGWQQVCLGGTQDVSEACLAADAFEGGVACAVAANHDPVGLLPSFGADAGPVVVVTPECAAIGSCWPPWDAGAQDGGSR